MGSLTIEAEVDDHDIVYHLIDHPSLITQALQELAKPDRRGPNPGFARFAAALRAIGGDATANIDNAYAGVEEWAEAFRLMDCIDREMALAELDRQVPGVLGERLAGAA